MSEFEKFERKLALHTAPTLLGIKCASLISLSLDEFDICANINNFNRRAKSKGLEIKSLCKCEKRMLIILYNKRLMEDKLSDSEARKMLSDLGYAENFTLDECLEKLGERIGRSSEFPHEIGLFLNYPLEDVVGFIENKGENFKLCGVWKVYGNVENAKRTFINYDKCRDFLCGKLNEGFDIYQALKIS